MEQHPVPQPITSYQFHLVGDMTLQQFGQLAGGLLIAFFIYSLNIPTFLKWPGILFFGFAGFAFAFIPLEERPLSKWAVAYFKSIFSPTHYLWKQSKPIPSFFLKTPPAQTEAPTQVTQADTQKLQTYLQSLRQSPGQAREEEREKLEEERIGALFHTAQLPSSLKVVAKRLADSWEDSKPQLKLKPRKLVVPPSTSVILRTEAMPGEKKKAKPKPVPIAPPSAKPIKQRIQASPTDETLVRVAPLGIKQIPTAAPKPIEKKPELPQVKAQPEVDLTPTYVPPKQSIQATTAADLPIPAAPDTPNVVVGMVLDSTGKLVDNAIIEIRDQNGLPVRALKSNQLGQFRIVTALPDGTYELEVEKEGLSFDIINISLTGELVRPIEIRAKAT